MSEHTLEEDHPDFSTVKPLVEAIVDACGGHEKFVLKIPPLFRLAIDEVIDSARTGRFGISELEKTEKTYIGTKVEIVLRNALGFPKGNRLDLLIDGQECDIKNTTGNSWTIPPENFDLPAILVRQNEKKWLCDLGVGVLRLSYMNEGQNRDKKRSLTAAHRDNDIWWLLRDYPYPVNFWEQLDPLIRGKVFSAGAATKQLATLFDLVREVPISRTHIGALGQQHDYMNRIRRNGGARDILAPKGVALLWGKNDRALIQKLNLGPVKDDEFISYAPKSDEEHTLLKVAKHID